MNTSLAHRLGTALVPALVVSCALVAHAATTESVSRSLPTISQYSENQIQHGRPVTGFARAAADSFNLYGGVRSDGTNDRRPEGQFQNIDLAPMWQDWFGADRTENPVFWHVDSFNAANLDVAPGNRAMWSGVPAGEPGYVNAPGYGNNWNDIITWTGETNPFQNTTVQLTFDFNHDTEAGYDYFIVEYDSAGSWIEWTAIDGTNKEADGTFLTAATFDEQVQYTPLMYAGDLNTEIRLRMRVVSDGAWSDEDGLFQGKGAVQMDNIRVRFNGVLTPGPGGDGVATFEDLGGNDDTEGWDPVPSEFAGDFAKVLKNLKDIDPCRDNLGPQLGFVDNGLPPSNSTQSTGGSTSANWQYGVLGNWVVNYTGGLSLGLISLNNEVWSPVIAWDDTTSVEDDGLVGGAFMRFTVWQHLPLFNGMFWIWSVRSSEAGDWTPWLNRNFVYYGDGGGVYNNTQFDVTDLLLPNRDGVQIALGVIDLAATFGFPGNDATPSPSFDNVSFWRYDSGGPAFATRNIDLFQDGFPNSGAADPLDPATLSVRMDMARDISTGAFNTPGDSIIVDVAATVPGSELAALPTMHWILDANPAFDGVRSLPGGASAAGTSSRGWNKWSGTVLGDSSRTASGAPVAGRFFMDLPNDGAGIAAYHGSEPAMFFPGDRIRYFISAEDTEGQISTLPPDTTGFHGGGTFPRLFTIRALPSIVDDGQGGFTQPNILVVNDFGHRGGENEWLGAFTLNGLAEDIDYDVFTVRGPSSLVSNGIGSSGAHGANAGQLSEYETMIYFAGNLSVGLLSDGTALGANDKGNDIDLLNQWHAQAGNRYAVYFGDYIATGLIESGGDGSAYLSSVLGVDYNDDSVRDEIGGQAAPIVIPVQPQFTTEFVAYGGCLAINEFDSINPLAGALAGHAFTDPDGLTPYGPVASVWHGRTEIVEAQSYDRVDVTFAYGFSFVYDPIASRTPVGVQARVLLLRELLQAFGEPIDPPTLTGAPGLRRLEVARNVPNPFNPSTRIAFVAPSSGPLSVRIFNLRGEVVRVLRDGPVAAGPGSVTWNGDDDQGHGVASGIYFYEVRGFGERVTGKMALVK